jgi:hypothetical protein
MIMGCAINKQQEDQCQQWGFEAWRPWSYKHVTTCLSIVKEMADDMLIHTSVHWWYIILSIPVFHFTCHIQLWLR